MPGLTKQQQAALVLNKNLSVTAGAGSGKTKILVDRFLKIVTINSGKVRRVLAITFTKKAAAEMLERITSEINHRMADAKDQKTQKNYLLIRDQLNNAAVSTIHSFCAKILREFPFEAGLPPDFSEMDEMQAIVIRQQAIDRVFSWLDEVEESKRNTLAQLFNTLTINNIRKMLHQAMALPYEMGLIQQHYNRTTEDQHLQWLENIWLEKVKPILSPEAVLEIKGRSTAILEADNHAEKNEKALGVLNQLRNLKEHSQYDPDSLNMLKCVINLIKKITNNSGSAYRNLGQIGGKKSWSAESGDLLIQLSAYCESYASQLIAANAGPPPGESDKLWYKLINIFLELFARCNEYYQELKMDNGLVDFEDLQLYVFHLLHNHPDIANKLANNPFISRNIRTSELRNP